MAVPVGNTTDAMAHMVIAGEGGILATIVTRANDAARVASLAAEDSAPTVTQTVESLGVESRQAEYTLSGSDTTCGTRQEDTGGDQVILHPQLAKRPFC